MVVTCSNSAPFITDQADLSALLLNTCPLLKKGIIIVKKQQQLSLNKTFSSDLYSILGSPKINEYYFLHLISDDGSVFSVKSDDENCLISNCQSLRLTKMRSPKLKSSFDLIFHLTSLNPIQWTLYG